MDTRNRETIELTKENMDIFDDESLFEEMEHTESPYKHSITLHEFVHRRKKDNKFFAWGYMSDYNSGLLDDSLENAWQVFPKQKIITVYE